MKQLADLSYNATLGVMVGKCQKLLEGFLNFHNSRNDTRTPLDIVRARKKTIEDGLRDFLERETPEIDVILDGTNNNLAHPLNAYWTVIGIEDCERVARFLASRDPHKSHAGTFALALVVGGKVRCAAVGGIFSPWVVVLPAKVPPNIDDPQGDYTGALALAPYRVFGCGEITLGGDSNSELPGALCSLLMAFSPDRRVTHTSRLGSLCRLWTSRSNMHIEPPGTDCPAIMAPALGFGESLDIVNLRLDGSTLHELTPKPHLTTVPRDYWTVTLRRDQLANLDQWVSVVPLS